MPYGKMKSPAKKKKMKKGKKTMKKK